MRNQSLQVPAYERQWLIPVVCIAAVQFGVAMYLSPVGVIPTLGAFAVLALAVITAILTVRLLIFLWTLSREGESHPLRRVGTAVVDHRHRAGAALVAICLTALNGAAFSSLKDAIPSHVPFWLDPYLTSGEAILGKHPWQITHGLVGWATPAIDIVYASWLAVQTVTYYVLLLLPASSLKSRALVSHSLTWLVLGVFGAYIGSSVGPIFHDRVFGGSDFAALNAAIGSDAPIALRTSEMLWRAYALHTNEVGSGISAMPSLHVAMTLWLCLVVKRTRLAWLAWTYYALICLGSVHLGWHYVSDGIVGSLGALAIWSACGGVGVRTRLPARKLTNV